MADGLCNTLRFVNLLQLKPCVLRLYLKCNFYMWQN